MEESEETETERESKELPKIVKSSPKTPGPKSPTRDLAPSPEQVDEEEDNDDNPEELIHQHEKSNTNNSVIKEDSSKNTPTSVIISNGGGGGSSSSSAGSAGGGGSLVTDDKQSIDKPKGKIRRKCIICTEKLEQKDSSNSSDSDVKPPPPPKSAEECAQEELAVVFFLQKFLEHSLIPEQSLEDLLTQSKLRKRKEREAAAQEGVKEGEPDERCLINEDNFDWIWFCPNCLQHVQKARQLCMQITDLQEKLNELREEVLEKVVSTIVKESQKIKSKSEREAEEEEHGRLSHLYSNVRHSIYHKKTGLVFQAEQNEMCPSSFVEVKVKAECTSDSWDDQFEEPMTPAWQSQGLVDEDGLRVPTTNTTGFGMPTGDAPPRRPQLNVQLEDVVIRPSTTVKRKKRYKKQHSYTMKSSKNSMPKRKRGRPRKNPVLPQSVPQNYDDTSLLENEEVIKEEDTTTRKRSTPRRASQRRVNYREGGNSDAEEMFFKLEFTNEVNDYNSPNEDIGGGGFGVGGGEVGPSDEEQEEKPKPRKRGRPRKLDGPKKYVKKKKLVKRENNDSMDGLLHRRDNRGLGKCSIESRTCPVCQRVFINPSKMLVHLNVKHERKILFHCEVCNRGFLRKDYLREHKKVHLSPEEKMLEKARRECGIKKKKVRKIGTAEGEEGPVLSCAICKSTFESVQQMHRHINYFHGKTEGYTCEVCQKKFQWKDGLKKHMKVFHEGTKKFKCTFEGCGSAFYYKKHLQVHERIHTGAKDFLCAMCGVSFRHEWSFNRHNIFKHHKVTSKTYLCETCGKSFKIKSHLDQHLQSKSHGGAGLKRRIRNRNKNNLNTNKSSSSAAASGSGSSGGSNSTAVGAAVSTTNSSILTLGVVSVSSSPESLKLPESMKVPLKESPRESPPHMAVPMDLQNRLSGGGGRDDPRMVRLPPHPPPRLPPYSPMALLGHRMVDPDEEDDDDDDGMSSGGGSSVRSHSPMQIPPPGDSDTNTNSCGGVGGGDNESQGSSRGGGEEYLRYSSPASVLHMGVVGGAYLPHIHHGHGSGHHPIHHHGHLHGGHSQHVSSPPPPPPTSHPPSSTQLYDALAHYQQHQQQGGYPHPGYVSPPGPMHHHQQ